MSRFGSLAFLGILEPAACNTSLAQRSPLWAACPVACLLALSGCAAVEVKMGQRVYLNKTPVTSMQASLPKGPGIAPGEKSPLVVSLTAPDGKVLMTEGEGHGKVLWQDLTVTASVVAVDKKGNVSLPADPRISDGKLPHVTITAPSQPDLHADLDIPLRYDRKFSARFSGSSGSNGLDGRDGMDGANGSMGSIDPNHPSAGGDGSNGTNGTDGDTGRPGDDGPPVLVLVALRSGDHPLLQVRVSAEGHDRLFLVDPQGGSLSVTSEGGSGGSGGRGGRGGRGGSGGIGIPSGRSGNDGSSGHDGLNGSSGSGGRISVTYDPQAQPFLRTIHVSSPGGSRPVFREQTVAPLW